MNLDLSALERAVEQLTNGLDRFRSAPADELLRDGVIQRFEYTYELCFKTLKRYLALTEASADEIAHMSFQDVIKIASERGLLARGWEGWRTFRTARNMTSHTYDVAKAEEVVEQAPAFLAEARHLVGDLRKRIKA